MSDSKYLDPCQNGRWAISREVGGVRMDLVQDTPLDDPAQAAMILTALRIEASAGNIEHYFPNGRIAGERRPTLQLLELFARLSHVRHEHGV